jgi:hypothetical protein
MRKSSLFAVKSARTAPDSSPHAWDDLLSSVGAVSVHELLIPSVFDDVIARGRVFVILVKFMVGHQHGTKSIAGVILLN